jgi:hypothetical protein
VKADRRWRRWWGRLHAGPFNNACLTSALFHGGEQGALDDGQGHGCINSPGGEPLPADSAVRTLLDDPEV